MLSLELGRVAQRLGDFPEAMRQYDTVIATSATSDLGRHARRNRARVLLELGPSGEARAWNDYDQLISEEPGDADARTGRALLALRTGRPAIADVGLTNLLAEPADDTRRTEWLAARALAASVAGANGRCRDRRRPCGTARPVTRSTTRSPSCRHRVGASFGSGRARPRRPRKSSHGRSCTRKRSGRDRRQGRQIRRQGGHRKRAPSGTHGENDPGGDLYAPRRPQAGPCGDRSSGRAQLARGGRMAASCPGPRRAGDADGAVADIEAGLALAPAIRDCSACAGASESRRDERSKD